MSLFHKPTGEWTDRELAAGLGVLTTERDTAVAAGEPDRAERLNALACVLADQRDARARVLDEAAAAANPVGEVAPARILRVGSRRRRDRQRRTRGG